MFLKTWRRCVNLFIACCLVLGITPSSMTAASATTLAAPAAKADTWTLKDGDILSYPKGLGDSRAFTRTLIKAIKQTRKGAKIAVSTYAISDMAVVEPLVEAKKKRGVIVQFTTWTKGANATETSRKVAKALKKALGDISGAKTKKLVKDKAASKSYYMACRGSCYVDGKDKAAQHFKGVTISELKTPSGQILRNVSFLTSANLSKAAVNKSWNHAYVMVNRSKIYNALRSYMLGMRYDRTKRNFPVVTDGPYTLYLYPQAKVVNPIASTLKQVEQAKCAAGKGYGNGKGKAVIRIFVHYWTAPEYKAAVQVARLSHKYKCDIAVIVSRKTARRGVVKRLLFVKNKKGKFTVRSGVRVYDAYQSKSGAYAHNKDWAFSGKLGKGKKAKNVNLLYTGSANMTETARARNTDVTLAVRGTEGAVSVANTLRFFNQVAKVSKLMTTYKSLPKR
ncbi:hypothetical protein EYC58_04865 [Candidatus Saccharibacteria bacterium]|nr:MAG: hypothetical protein EYC58_04865 [Candidatus Saccharibacteria bacterium]